MIMKLANNISKCLLFFSTNDHYSEEMILLHLFLIIYQQGQKYTARENICRKYMYSAAPENNMYLKIQIGLLLYWYALQPHHLVLLTSRDMLSCTHRILWILSRTASSIFQQTVESPVSQESCHSLFTLFCETTFPAWEKSYYIFSHWIWKATVDQQTFVWAS